MSRVSLNPDDEGHEPIMKISPKKVYVKPTNE